MIWNIAARVPSLVVWLSSALLGMALFFLWRRYEAAGRRVEEHLASMDARIERLIALLEMRGGSREMRGASIRRTSAGTYSVAEGVSPTRKAPPGSVKWEGESAHGVGEIVQEARAHLREVADGVGEDDLLEVSRRLKVGIGETRLISKLMELKSE